MDTSSAKGIDRAASDTRPSEKTTCSAVPASTSAATTASRSRMRRAAICAALPFMSLPVDAAVAEVLATFSVSVAVERTVSSGTPSSCATTWRTFVLTP